MMKANPQFFIIFALLVSYCHLSNGNGARKGKPPLLGEGSSKKNSKRSTECQFGKRSYELEETWHPDLGPPFGVMFCIRCECMAVQKKRKITGRTVCKNVKNECPKITCSEPILPPGHCCKTCPDGKDHTLLKEDVFAGHEEDDKSGKDFAAVLVGPLSMTPSNLTSVASIRLAAHRRNLQFSVSSTGDFKPKAIQFMNDEGTVLEEQELGQNEYREATGKVCGSWRRMPRIYRQLLREEKLWVSITSVNGNTLSARPTRFRSLASEALSALLAPDDPSAYGAGATAIVSLSSSSNSVHVSLVVSGLLRREIKEMDSVLVVTLVAAESEDGDKRVIEELFSVQKPQDQSVIEIRTVLEPHELKQLTRGKVMLTVYSKRYPNARLSGIVGTRVTCDIFDAIVQPSTESDSKQNSLAFGWFYLTTDGSLSYRVSLDGVGDKIKSLAIEVPQSKLKKKRTIQEMSILENWANGTTTRLTPRDLEALYAGELFVSAELDKDVALRGKIINHPVSDSHFDLNGGPLLLTSSSSTKVGIAWVGVDDECSLHYDLQVNTQRKKSDLQPVSVLELVENPRPLTTLGQPFNSKVAASIMLSSDTEVENGILLLSPNVRVLEEFSSSQADNSVSDISPLTLARMEAGGTYLKLTESGGPNSPGFEIQGQIKTVKVPPKCLPQYPKNALIDGETGDSQLPRGYVLDEENEIPKTPHCLYEGRLYEDGQQWNAEHSKCTMCSCQRGRIFCDPVVCPVMTCDKTVQVEGECCPVCQNVTSPKRQSSGRNCYFEGDKKYYPAGTKWHPYIPPFGFSKCAICSCNATTLKVECTRITCPEPPCPESERYRPDPKSCCQECRRSEPPVWKPTGDEGEQDEEAQAKSDAEVLASGGCRFKGDMYENGNDWHPRILPWGEIKCINCNCKDGKVKCKRRKCPKNRCVSGARTATDECCPPCEQEKAKDAKRKQKTKPKRTSQSVKHDFDY